MVLVQWIQGSRKVSPCRYTALPHQGHYIGQAHLKSPTNYMPITRHGGARRSLYYNLSLYELLSQLYDVMNLASAFGCCHPLLLKS